MTTIAIIGNPNCGKTTLFNSLTGAQQKVGNWPGVTVTKKTGHYEYQGRDIDVVDLPGVYSLNVPSDDSAIDELIACQYIVSQEADLYINIIDAANLKRNLYLTLQLLEMRVPVIVAVNMCDVAKQRKIDIDLKALSEQLGCPVVPLVCHKGQGVRVLKREINEFQSDAQRYLFQTFPPHIEQELKTLEDEMHTRADQLPSNLPARWLATRLLEGDALTKRLLPADVVSQCDEAQHDLAIAEARYAAIDTVLKQTVKETKALPHTVTGIVDHVVMHRWFGIPMFLFIMYLMFEMSMNVGSLLVPLFDVSSTTIFIDGVHYLGQLWHWPVWLIAMLSQGVGLGINTILSFIPQIGLLFLCLAVLEDSGYMARAAFVMDRFMQAVGLPGKSFVPLIVGFGCNVPSIMATRGLDQRRDRILTSMMAPFMSCGARLAIFVVFGAAFFPNHAGAMVFLLYIIGIAVAILTGFLLKHTILRGETTPFLLEMPVYHRPHLKTILFLTWHRLKGFVMRAGRYIIPICVIIGTLNVITVDGKLDLNGSHNSVMASLGRKLSPALAPMGVQRENWPAAVGLITGTLAKEVVVGTLNTLYSPPVQSNATTLQNYSLWGGLKTAVSDTVTGFADIFSARQINPFTANEADHSLSRSAMGTMVHAFVTPAAAFAYLLFVLLYIPCVSTMAVLAREIGKGWSWFAIGWSLLIAYSAGTLYYQIASLSVHPLVALSWIAAVIGTNGIFLNVLRRFGRARAFV